MMDKVIRQYYQLQMHGGRSKAARVADAVAFHLLVILASYLWFRYNLRGTAWVVLFTCILTALFACAYALLQRLRFDRFVKKEQGRLAEIVLRERVLLMPEGSYDALCEKAICADSKASRMRASGHAYIHKTQKALPLSEDDVLAAYRLSQQTYATELVLCCLSPMSEGAAALFAQLPMEAVRVEELALLRAAADTPGYTVNEVDVEAYIVFLMEARARQRERVRANSFSATHARKYFICGLLLFGVSFFAGYSLYYRLLASVCMLLACAAAFVNGGDTRKSLLRILNRKTG